jgi:hypothetical protein
MMGYEIGNIVPFPNSSATSRTRLLAADPESSGPRILITEKWPGWREPVLERLKDLCKLPVGWDGYQGGPVDFRIAEFALRMLAAACGPDTPVPSIVPGPSGDLQVEWHLQSGDIELHVRAPNSVHAWRWTPDLGEDGEERSLTVDFTDVSHWIIDLTESARAIVPAAA